MANLRDRLRRIQDNKKAEPPQPVRPAPADIPFLAHHGWASCGFQTVKREVAVDGPFDVPAILPPALPVLVPDLERVAGKGRALPLPEDFLFFDLETTGLSGGAGTVAFLAAFGRFVPNGVAYNLHITQYLLLDFPGENDFLEAVLGEFKQEPLVVVSYNGKSFDSQILKTRCLMNGMRPPAYSHADLLHPARRLWKRILPDCSQGTIETRILGMDRSGDIPGAMAPEIWFSFLKTGDAGPLMEICEHNRRDISGLAAILVAAMHIAADPCTALAQYRFDVELLALRWREWARLSDDAGDDGIRITGDKLLRLAAKKKYPKASFVYALDQLRGGNFDEGRKKLLAIAVPSFPEHIQAAALRALAIDSERRLKDSAQALEFVMRGMELQLTGESWRNECERRALRLEKKIAQQQAAAVP